MDKKPRRAIVVIPRKSRVPLWPLMVSENCATEEGICDITVVNSAKQQQYCHAETVLNQLNCTIYDLLWCRIKLKEKTITDTVQVIYTSKGIQTDGRNVAKHMKHHSIK